MMHPNSLRPGFWRRGPLFAAATGLAIGGAAVLADRANRAAPADAAAPHFDTERIARILEPVVGEVEARAFPGAAVAFGVADREVYTFGVGEIGWTDTAAEVDPGATRYDLASLTKVVATAPAVMLLAEDGALDLDEPVSNYLPNFGEGAKAEITIRHLLTHTSGLPAGAVLRGRSRAEKIDRATRLAIYPPAGARVEYSDIGYVLLWEIAEQATEEPLEEFLQHRLFEPLGMTETGFAPGLECEACAPTGRLRDQRLYRGRPFDPTAQDLDGVSGNAGLFSTAADLGRFAAMIANGGELDGVRVLADSTVAEFTRVQADGRFALGWEVRCTDELATEPVPCLDPRWIGHTGYTGTYMAIEPETGVWVVLLTNRTYEPKAPNQIQQVRRDVFDRAVQPRGLAARDGVDPAHLAQAGGALAGQALGAEAPAGEAPAREALAE